MNIAAFFDIDGTLLGPPSLERRFLRYLRWRGELTATHWARWLARFLWRAWRRGLIAKHLAGSSWLAATEANKAHLAGVRTATMDAWTASLGRRPLPFFSDALQRLEWHAAQGHRIFLVSGTLRPLAEAVAKQLPVPATACATELDVRDGCLAARAVRCWSGEVVGEAISGPGKARGLERLAAEHRIDLGRSYAYDNSWSDRWMLERVGYPAAVNPSAALAWLAQRRGWPVLAWDRAKTPGTRRDTGPKTRSVEGAVEGMDKADHRPECAVSEITDPGGQTIEAERR